MVRSMTGYGRSEVSKEDKKIVAEIKSVNNRFLDLTVKMPRKLNPLESKIRDEIKTYIQRGKVDLFITLEDLSDSDEKVKYNHALAQEYIRYMKDMSAEFGLKDDIRVTDLARMADVFTVEDLDEGDVSEFWPLLKNAVDEAGEAIAEARTREGMFLSADIQKKLDVMTGCVDYITERSPEIVRSYQEKLTAKIHDLLGDAGVDENRIAEEVTIYADKICVDEELVRLRSHIRAMRDTLLEAEKAPAGSEGVGRKLDFLAQEMNRESNTILSKTDDVGVSAQGIVLKTNIEKIREQIQNLE